MNFEISLREGYVKVVGKNIARTKSLVISSKQAIEIGKSIPLKEVSTKSIFRELYEGLRQFCEAIGYFKGYKFMSHETISYFLRDILNEHKISQDFDRYRKLRNRTNYYGDDIDTNTVKEALDEIPKMIKILEGHLANN